MKTHLPKKIGHAGGQPGKWYVIDAANKPLGKVAVAAARILTGKDRVDMTPHLDLGDGVIVLNASQVSLSGNKTKDKLYRTHSGYRGNLKEVSAGDMLAKKPAKVLELAVTGMLPKNKLRDPRMARLKVYPAAEHPHAAQNPTALTLS